MIVGGGRIGVQPFLGRCAGTVAKATVVDRQDVVAEGPQQLQLVLDSLHACRSASRRTEENPVAVRVRVVSEQDAVQSQPIGLEQRALMKNLRIKRRRKRSAVAGHEDE